MQASNTVLRFAAAAAVSFIVAGLATTASATAVWTMNINTNNVITVTNAPYNAVSDGLTDNAPAISNAIVAASSGGNVGGLFGGTVRIPGPGIYLSGPIQLKKNVNLQVEAGAILRMLDYNHYPGGIINPPDFITGSGVTNIEVSGGGAIDGQGAPWWPGYKTNSRPDMIHFTGCTRQLIQNVTLSNSPQFHMAFSSSKGSITVQGVTVRAPSPDGHNTDACDVSGTNVLVQNCNISVSDDDFTCGGGTSDVLLTNNTYGNGHGVSIGSYTQGVSNIMVINCTFNGTDNGIRIKSDNDRSGIVQNISYYNIGMTNVHFPIQIYGYYNLIGTPSSITPYYAATQAVAAVVSTTPVFRNITFSNINATSTAGFPIGIIWARTELPATNIVFNKVNITGDEPFDLYNVSGAQFIDCDFKVSAGYPSFELFNAQTIITNSAPTNTMFTFDGLTTNGYGSSLAFYNAAGSLKNTNCFDDGPLTLSASTFTVSNNLTLFPATLLNFVLGTNATKLAVVGNLALGGTNNIAAGAGFTNGTYTVMSYTGTLSGALPTLNSVVPGYNYSYDTNTTGQVKLVVSSTALTAPDAPANLVASAANALVTLNWSPSPTATNYNVKRSTTSGGGYLPLASVATTSYSDTQVTNGTTYYYIVAGVNAAGEGTNSAQASATPQQTTSIVVTTNVFTDDLSTSTLNSVSPSVPNQTNTSYQVVSSKSWSPAPSLAAGHLKYGIGATTSGSIEMQALFAGSPVTLATVGDSVSLAVTFTNTSGLLTQSGAMGFGLYSSGQNYPVPGGMNGTATTAFTDKISGNAQMWAGYVGQLAFTGGSSRIMTRLAQTVGVLSNNVQDAVTSGSGSSSYNYPAAATVGTASSTPSVTLVAGNPYTAMLTVTLTATDTLAITNSLYSGTDTNGTLLSQFGGSASGATYLTNAFDALAVGWRATANTSPTTIDINAISVTATLTVPVTNTVALPNAPANLVATASNLLINLKWNSVNGATNYNLKRGTINSGSYPTIFHSLTTTNYADANVTNAVNYFYVVTANGAGGESTNSLPASAAPLPSNQPTNLVIQAVADNLQLSWPQSHLGWRLQIQTNDLSNGLGTNWATVPNSTSVNSASIPIMTTNGSVFLRLTYP